MAMRPPTWPATVSCRTLSRIVTRCDTDNPDCITCDTSRRLRHSSCREAEPDSSTPEKRYCGTFVAFLGGPQCPWGSYTPLSTCWQRCTLLRLAIQQASTCIFTD